MKKRKLFANIIGVSVYGVLIFLYDFFYEKMPADRVLIKTVISMAIMYLVFHFFMRPRTEKP